MKAYTLTAADKNKLGDKTETEYTVSEHTPSAEALQEKIDTFLADQDEISTDSKKKTEDLIKRCETVGSHFRIFGCDAHETAVGFVRSMIDSR